MLPQEVMQLLRQVMYHSLVRAYSFAACISNRIGASASS